MTTTEQRDKRVETRQNRLTVLAPKLDTLNERVEKFDEDMKAKRTKLTERRDRTKTRVDQLTREIEWFKSMPVDGTPDSDEDAGTDESGEATDLPDEHDGDEPQADSDEDAQTEADETGAPVRGPGGRFLPRQTATV